MRVFHANNGARHPRAVTGYTGAQGNKSDGVHRIFEVDKTAKMAGHVTLQVHDTISF